MDRATLYDTSLLYRFLQGSKGAARIFREAERRGISSVTLLELAQMCRPDGVRAALNDLLADFSVQIYPLSERIVFRAEALLRDTDDPDGNDPDGNMSLPEALIYSTAYEHRLRLLVWQMCCFPNPKSKDVVIVPCRCE
jgi:predicted nucleic acid-binding protein